MAEHKETRSARTRLEDWMANPGCEQNEASAILNYSLTNLDGADKSKVAPSTLATFLGNTFERDVVFKIGPLLSDNKQLGINTDMPWSIGKPKDVSAAKDRADDQIEESKNRLREILVESKDTSRNHILNGFRIPFEPFAPAKTIEIDLVALSPVAGEPNRFNFVIGEVKVYADQGGYTDEHKLSGARRQAGLYLGILREWLESLPGSEAEFANFEFTVEHFGFLVLSRPHSVLDSAEPDAWEKFEISLVVNENLDTQQEIIDHNYVELLKRFENYGHMRTATIEEKKEFIEALAHEFNEGCWGRCPMAQICHDEAVAANDPIILGSRVKNAMRGLELGEVQSLAQDSLDGSVVITDEMSDAARAIAKDFDEFRFRELDEI
jgi:hypothetical protein